MKKWYLTIYSIIFEILKDEIEFFLFNNLSNKYKKMLAKAEIEK